ncbi:unnamed protein product [Heterobilharzia americana]|nr:unnamed protein product [Heterobilharzia americana]
MYTLLHITTEGNYFDPDQSANDNRKYQYKLVQLSNNEITTNPSYARRSCGLPIFSNNETFLTDFYLDGNGGLYRALMKRGILSDMKSRGIEYVQIYCVDNILVKLPDLHFIGFCIENNADCAAQVVQKFDPEESIGVVGVVDGHYQVVEYSEISPSTASLRVNQYDHHDDLNNSKIVHNNRDLSYTNNLNRLVYSHGNICVHFTTRLFLESVCQDDIQMKMKYHRAQKKVIHIDIETGEQIIPQKPNAIKFEKFVFDVFPFAKRFFIWEVPRDEQFSPIKNGPGAIEDCPKTSRNDLLNYHTRLAKNAGAIIIDDHSTSNGNGYQNSVYEKALIEISPLITYDGEHSIKLFSRLDTICARASDHLLASLGQLNNRSVNKASSPTKNM